MTHYGGMKRWAAGLLVTLFLFPAFFYAFEQENRIVTGISARAEGGRVKLTWALPETPAAGFLVYRSGRPIRNTGSLTGNNLAATLPGDAAEYSEDLQPKEAVFYAVIAVFDGRPFTLIVPTYNATVRGISASVPGAAASQPAPGAHPPAAEQKIEGIRNLPLPSLSQNEQSGSGGISERDAAEAYLLSQEETNPGLSPYIFPQEQNQESTGENFLLYDIVSGLFIRGDYAAAAEKIAEFLQITRSREITARAKFYQGECAYFTGDFRGAVSCFLDVKDAFPELSRRWLDAALGGMSVP